VSDIDEAMGMHDSEARNVIRSAGFVPSANHVLGRIEYAHTAAEINYTISIGGWNVDSSGTTIWLESDPIILEPAARVSDFSEALEMLESYCAYRAAEISWGDSEAQRYIRIDNICHVECGKMPPNQVVRALRELAANMQTQHLCARRVARALGYSVETIPTMPNYSIKTIGVCNESEYRLAKKRQGAIGKNTNDPPNTGLGVQV